MNQIIKMAIAVAALFISRNLGLLAERFNISISEARIIQARLRPNPVLSLGGNYLDILGSGFNPSSAAGPGFGDGNDGLCGCLAPACPSGLRLCSSPDHAWH